MDNCDSTGRSMICGGRQWKLNMQLFHVIHRFLHFHFQLKIRLL